MNVFARCSRIRRSCNRCRRRGTIGICCWLPLCLGVAVVYKSIKCASMRHVPREASVVFLSIIGGILFAAAVLALIVKLAA